MCDYYQWVSIYMYLIRAFRVQYVIYGNEGCGRETHAQKCAGSALAGMSRMEDGASAVLKLLENLPDSAFNLGMSEQFDEHPKRKKMRLSLRKPAKDRFRTPITAAQLSESAKGVVPTIFTEWALRKFIL